MEFKHIPVMLEEVISGLNIKENGIYVDGTLGGGGHSLEIAKRLSKEGLLIGIDRDSEAIVAAFGKFQDYIDKVRFDFIKENHDNIKEILKEDNIDKVDGILLDLGVSSYQLDEKSRGFSYMGSGNLDMRMDKSQEFSAKDVVNKYSEEELAEIIYKYGEEKNSRKIARNIVLYREKKEIETTDELVQIIENSVGFSNGHPAKKTFQAIRIEVNNELKPLYNLMIDSVDLLKSGGRLAVITFHSLEDRIVKEAFKEMEGYCSCPKEVPICTCGYEENSKGKIITKKPIEASIEEQNINPRSKSAKLRIFEKK